MRGLLSKIFALIIVSFCLANCRSSKSVVRTEELRTESLSLRHFDGTVIETTVTVEGVIDTIDNSVRFRPSPNIPAKLIQKQTTVNLADTTTTKSSSNSQYNVNTKVVGNVKGLYSSLSFVLLFLGLSFFTYLIGRVASRL